MRVARVLSLLCVPTLLVAPARGQFITGTVVGPTGAPVPGVNIDAFDSLSGDPVDLVNDGTNANGVFLSELDDPGVYDFRFRPPGPPATQLLIGEKHDVVVISVTNLGTIVLDEGVLLSGMVRDTIGFPVAHVDLDVTDLVTSADVPLSGDKTNAFGTFSVLVPRSDLQVDLDPILVQTGVLAPRRFELSPTTNTHLGLIVLEPGFFLTARVVGPGGAPVAGADIDAVLGQSQEQILTLHDNANGNGDLSTVVPAGRYDFEFCPPVGQLVQAKKIAGVTVASDVDLGNVSLPAGVSLSGFIKDAHGKPLKGADVDVNVQSSGAVVTLCHDNADATGHYAVIVPTGTFTVEFSPPTGFLLAPDLHSGVVVNGNKVLNGVLSADLGHITGPSPGAPAAPAVPGATTGQLSPAGPTPAGSSGGRNLGGP